MIISIMGLIGSGKSSLTRALKEKNGYTVFMEPTKESEGADENPYLDDYYKDPKRYAFTMQVHLLFERYKMFQEAHYRSLRGEDCVIDSSYYSDYAFALVQRDDGYFTDKEFSTYTNMHKVIASQTVYPNIVLFLKADIDTVIKRISYRSRECESSIQKDYLLSLMNTYDIILNDLKRHIDIVYLDANKSIDEVYSDANSVIDNYKNNFIYY